MVNNIDIKKRAFDGYITQALPNTMFKVELDGGKEVLATLTGKVRRKFRRIMPGDRVRIELSPYEEDRGRVIFKYNK